MDLSSSEGGYARGGVRRDSEGRHKEAEYGHAIHCNATILDLCERATQRVGARLSQRWWYQEGIDLKAAKESSAEAIATDSESESDLGSEAEVEAESEVGG